ncbi:AraC family transcriptional regulator [Rhizobium calliandrae]|uniref:AraC family transcriptional regulator n=1 Tax=Rhizobium calliandrae TaxID=1312182 RepID=A0ABT7KNA1_9HYPH|nr:AraC family transcriptional regulator [Rhizobium calliandrae]MDL2410094.1 AraC family transcriptional regulator [Rhizobium calliandrae]
MDTINPMLRGTGSRSEGDPIQYMPDSEMFSSRLEGRCLLPNLAKLLERVHEELDSNREFAKSLLTRAVSLLHVEIDRHALPATTFKSGGLTGWQTRRVLAYIEEQLDQPVHVNELAAIAKLSRTYFSRAFKRTFDMTPHAYLMRRRLERAETLMITSDIILVEIALRCGFSDQAHLSRLFGREYGQSPAAWRRERTESSGQKATGGHGKLSPDDDGAC